MLIKSFYKRKKFQVLFLYNTNKVFYICYIVRVFDLSLGASFFKEKKIYHKDGSSITAFVNTDATET